MPDPSRSTAEAGPFPAEMLPPGIRSGFIRDVNGLRAHVLEGGHEEPGRPCLLLLHGFPELAFSWRAIMPTLVAAGYHVVAFDQRGYGRTTGWDGRFEGDVASFRFTNLVTDALALLAALGVPRVAAVIGHDFGSFVAGWCALARPDVFMSLVLMSAPFGGAPAIAGGEGSGPPAGNQVRLRTDQVLEGLAKLRRPREHYQWYYSGPAADGDMRHAPQGLAAFLRAYFHMKSADWRENAPHPLGGWTVEELARLPTYYVMDAGRSMAETVAPHMPSQSEIEACDWLTERDLSVYVDEFGRTGFQGALQWYRCGTDPRLNADLRLFAGRTVDVPSCYIAGESDWGIYQKPGIYEAMDGAVCTRMSGRRNLVKGAGHWVQQERPAETARLIIKFLREIATGGTP